MSHFAKSLLIALTVIVAGLLGVGGAHLLLGPSAPVHATVLQTPRPLPEFVLQDHQARAFAREDLLGRWSLLFFGFTECPDICPLTLQQLAKAVDGLEDIPATERPRLIFISVDPMRDTPERLRSYVRFFHEDFLGVTGSLAEIQAFTRNLGVATSYVANQDGQGYTIDHTASVFLVNPKGELRAIFGTPHEPDVIKSDYRAILAMSRAG